jgi:hypothetical protein
MSGVGLVECRENLKLFILDCEFYFEGNEDTIFSISIEKQLAGDFRPPVVSKTTTCSKMAISSADYLNVRYMTWNPFSRMDFNVINSKITGFSSIRVSGLCPIPNYDESTLREGYRETLYYATHVHLHWSYLKPKSATAANTI